MSRKKLGTSTGIAKSTAINQKNASKKRIAEIKKNAKKW